MSQAPREPQENVVISFAVKGEVYNKLMERLPDYGSRSQFFRAVLKQFLDGDLKITVEKEF